MQSGCCSTGATCSTHACTEAEGLKESHKLVAAVGESVGEEARWNLGGKEEGGGRGETEGGREGGRERERERGERERERERGERERELERANTYYRQGHAA